MDDGDIGADEDDGDTGDDVDDVDDDDIGDGDDALATVKGEQPGWRYVIMMMIIWILFMIIMISLI